MGDSRGNESALACLPMDDGPAAGLAGALPACRTPLPSGGQVVLHRAEDAVRNAGRKVADIASCDLSDLILGRYSSRPLSKSQAT